MDTAIIFCAQYLLYFVVLGLIVAWFLLGREDKKRFIISTLIACIVAYGIAKLASHLYFDPRPFVSEHIKPLIKHAADNGFPSDHALFTMTLTAATFFFSRKVASVMLVMTVLVGVARILAHVHSPLQIIAGWVFGIIGAVVGYYLMQLIFRTYGTKQTAEPKPKL